MLVFVLYCGYSLAVEVDAVGSRHAETQKAELSDDQGDQRLYFTGPGYTINLIPQALLLGLLSFLAVYFLGLDLFGSSTGGGEYGAPSVGYGAPEPSYGAPAGGYSAPASSGYDAPASSYTASGRYYDTYNQAEGASFDETRRKRSAF